MIPFGGRGILLDIEGTTSSVSFVYDVMFPFVRRELAAFLNSNWEQPAVRHACTTIVAESGTVNWNSWCQGDDQTICQKRMEQVVVRLMDADVKAPGLKALQGLIWESGFDSGELVAHIYDDVVPAITSWIAAGIDVRIYSSGSIAAQRLFFGHTQQGNLLTYFGGHYDTTTGSKKEPGSYRKIAEQFDHPWSALLFVSDSVEELNAANSAGWQTALCRRPGNGEILEPHPHPVIYSLAEIEIVSP